MNAPSATEEVRARVSADHLALRSLTSAVSRAAHAALCDEMQRPRVRGVLLQLLAQLEFHLELEDRELAPLLREADAWGPVRADRMAQDHAQQRAILVAVSEDAEDGRRPIDELVDELLWFVQRVERGIDDEENCLLSSEALGEELIVIDQIDG